MKTRIAPVGSPLRQERYSSSPAFHQGLLANLVARRCQTVEDASHRAALWFIQWRSWNGGLASLAVEFLKSFPLDRFGFEYRSATQKSFGPETFTRELVERLNEWCLDPDIRLPFGGFDCVLEYREKWIAERRREVVTTDIGRRIASALDYTYEARTLTVIDGDPRLGKSFAAKHWCVCSAGLMRYVPIPSSNDLASFLRAIADALGLSSNLNLKAQVLHERIRDALAMGNIGICFDEAHYAWPQGRLRAASPYRVNWIMTELCNAGIATAMVTTPQFYTAQAALEKQTAWSSAQWDGRLGHVETLPKNLSDADLRKVASWIMPGTDDRTITAVAAYAAESRKHLQSIDAIHKRATWLAHQAGRQTATTEDVKRAMKESVIPSDAAMNTKLKTGRKPAPRHHRETPAVHSRLTGETPAADNFHPPRATVPGLVIA